LSSATEPLDDAALLDGFERCTLPKACWTHQAHVRVAWLHLQRDAFPVALQKMGAGIRKLNGAHGVENGPSSGYHETLTCTFMCLIWAALQSAGGFQDSLEFCEANPHLLARTLPRAFYTRERMNSVDARQRFVPPDLAPLPQPPSWQPGSGSE
jgi:hypothetical protein